jgi:RNA polymerase sigma factor (sigma-70 family)
LAEDVSQIVFIDLALKASGLPSDVSLGGWLHRHTCFLARKALRRELRLKARERRAIELHLIDDCTRENLGEVSAVLDEAINDLGTEDRTAVLLRFFEQRDFQSVGRALGKSEDAARMRVSRALEKLGSLLKRRGITSSAAALGFVLETNAVAPVSAGLAPSISKGAIAGAARGQTAFALIREACFTRLNLGLVSASVVVGLATLLIAHRPSAPTKTFAVSQTDPEELAENVDEDSASQIVVAAPASPGQEQKRPSPSRGKTAIELADEVELPQPPPVPTSTPAPPVQKAVPQSSVGVTPPANPALGQWPVSSPKMAQVRVMHPVALAHTSQTGNGNARSSAPNTPQTTTASPWQTVATVTPAPTGPSSKSLSQSASNPKPNGVQPVVAPAQNSTPMQNNSVSASPTPQMPAFTPVAYTYRSPPRPKNASRKDPRLP